MDNWSMTKPQIGGGVDYWITGMIGSDKKHTKTSTMLYAAFQPMIPKFTSPKTVNTLNCTATMM
jgi:hypothetical protein